MKGIPKLAIWLIIIQLFLTLQAFGDDRTIYLPSIDQDIVNHPKDKPLTEDDIKGKDTRSVARSLLVRKYGYAKADDIFRSHFLRHARVQIKVPKETLVATLKHGRLNAHQTRNSTGWMDNNQLRFEIDEPIFEVRKRIEHEMIGVDLEMSSQRGKGLYPSYVFIGVDTGPNGKLGNSVLKYPGYAYGEYTLIIDPQVLVRATFRKGDSLVSELYKKDGHEVKSALISQDKYYEARNDFQYVLGNLEGQVWGGIHPSEIMAVTQHGANMPPPEIEKTIRELGLPLYQIEPQPHISVKLSDRTNVLRFKTLLIPGDPQKRKQAKLEAFSSSHEKVTLNTPKKLGDIFLQIAPKYREKIPVTFDHPMVLGEMKFKVGDVINPGLYAYYEILAVENVGAWQRYLVWDIFHEKEFAMIHKNTSNSPMDSEFDKLIEDSLRIQRKKVHDRRQYYYHEVGQDYMVIDRNYVPSELCGGLESGVP